MLQATPKPSGGTIFDGRRMLYVLLAFFGTIFAVNAVFIVKALRTYSGDVADEPYRTGLAYNQRIAADERQTALGWHVDLSLLAGKVGVSVVDQAGRPVTGKHVAIEISRPASGGSDQHLDLAEGAPGAYEGAPRALSAGTWVVDAKIGATPGGTPDFRLRRRVWLER